MGCLHEQNRRHPKCLCTSSDPASAIQERQRRMKLIMTKDQRAKLDNDAQRHGYIRIADIERNFGKECADKLLEAHLTGQLVFVI